MHFFLRCPGLFPDLCGKFAVDSNSSDTPELKEHLLVLEFVPEARPPLQPGRIRCPREKGIEIDTVLELIELCHDFMWKEHPQFDRGVTSRERLHLRLYMVKLRPLFTQIA